MTTALRILALCAALFAGLVLAALLVFGGPNYYGLRPHAVRSDLTRHDLDALTGLAQYGPVTGILSFDAWYEGRDGNTGWFLLPAAQAQGVGFNVNGALDPQLARTFGVAPRRCGDTSLPEKMLRAIEPERANAGFLGRSTCARSKMDISDVVAASSPAIRHSDDLNHKALLEFDAVKDPLVLRDYVALWPTPYAYERSVSLPLVWEREGALPPHTINTLRNKASAQAKMLSRTEGISARLEMQDWSAQYLGDDTARLLPFRMQDEIVVLTDIRFVRFDFIILCAPEDRAACDAIDVSALLPDVAVLRDAKILESAIAARKPLPDANMILRDVLHERALRGETVRAPASEERRFSITWYDARAQSALQ